MDKYERRRLRLIEARDLLFKGSIAAMARQLDKNESYVGRMLWPEGRSGRKRIGEDMVEHIETALALPRGTLDSDSQVGETLRHQLHTSVNPMGINTTLNIPDIRQPLPVKLPKGSVSARNIEPQAILPLLEWAQVGKENLPLNAREWLPSPIPVTRDAYYLPVEGLSMLAPMEPSFSDGDLILVDPTAEARNGALVVISLPDSDIPVFRQLVIEGPKRYLRALNPDWPNRITPIPPEATIRGIVRSKVVNY